MRRCVSIGEVLSLEVCVNLHAVSIEIEEIIMNVLFALNAVAFSGRVTRRDERARRDERDDSEREERS